MPSAVSSHQQTTPIRLIIQLCLLLTTNLTIVSSFSCGTLQLRPQQCKWQITSSSSSQLQSANYDEDDILDDFIMGDDIDGTVSGSGGMYTQGGVIMPEGGANPCVIKVR